MYSYFVKLSTVKKPHILITASVIIVVCLVHIYHHEFLERLERITYDWRVRQGANSASATVATNLGFVPISDQSLKSINNGSLGFDFGLYWPRQLYGRMLRELHHEGAQVIAFDILLSDLRTDHARVVTDTINMTSDEYCAMLMKQAGNVIIAADKGVLPLKLFRSSALAVGDISADHDSDGTLRSTRAFRTYRKWHQVFRQLEEDEEVGVDLSKAIIEPDQIRLPLLHPANPKEPDLKIPLTRDGNIDLQDFVGTNLPPGMPRFSKPFTDERIWHMGIVLAAQQLKLDLTNADVELKKGRITLKGPNGIKRVIPVTSDGSFYINWCMTANDPRLTVEPFEALLARDQARQTGDSSRFAQYMKAHDWNNKLVMVGSTATGNDLTDMGSTPLEKYTFLVSEHWNVANSILTGQFVRKSSLAVDLVLISLMGIVAASTTWIWRSWKASLCVLGVAAVYTAIAVLGYVYFRYWMPLVLPIMGGALLTHFCIQGYVVIFEQAERRRVRSVFNKVMAPDVVAELLKTDKLSSLDGARRKVTVFFSDIRGFTEMTDVSRDLAADYIKERNLTGDDAEAVYDKQARETLNTVNEYLSIIADIVRQNNGTVDKFIGDCVMAFWGAPIANAQHALHCVRAAVETQRAVYKLNQARLAENRQREATNLMLAAEGKTLLPMLPILVVGTGINTGVVTVGLMGSQDQLNYTVFGREVNLASRLEGVSGRSRVIISEATLAEIIQDDATLALSCKALPPVPVKGIREPVPIFEVPWREDGADEDSTPAPPADSYNTGYFTAGDKAAK